MIPLRNFSKKSKLKFLKLMRNFLNKSKLKFLKLMRNFSKKSKLKSYTTNDHLPITNDQLPT